MRLFLFLSTVWVATSLAEAERLQMKNIGLVAPDILGFTICDTIHKPMAGNAYVWGYLAARPVSINPGGNNRSETRNN